MLDVILEEAIDVELVLRAADSFDDDGNGVKGAEAPAVSIKAAVQPVTGDTLKNTPEGLRDEVSHAVWTGADLKTDNVIVYDGKRYTVIHTWERRSDGFTKAVIGELS